MPLHGPSRTPEGRVLQSAFSSVLLLLSLNVGDGLIVETWDLLEVSKAVRWGGSHGLHAAVGSVLSGHPLVRVCGQVDGSRLRGLGPHPTPPLLAVVDTPFCHSSTSLFGFVDAFCLLSVCRPAS